MGLPRISGEFGIVQDPDIRFSDGGKCWAKLRVVAKKRERDSSGQWVDGTPLFIDCVVFGAEHLAESVSKGDSVVIEGVLEQQEWVDKESGEKRSAFRIVADSVGVSTRWATARTPRTIESMGGAPAASSAAEPQESVPPF
jgi:single-strand DNA-binding protein